MQFVMSLLCGKALTWAIALWTEDSSLLHSSRKFQNAFKEVFHHSAIGRNISDQLLDLHQGNRFVADFSLIF